MKAATSSPLNVTKEPPDTQAVPVAPPPPAQRYMRFSPFSRARAGARPGGAGGY